MSKQDIVELHPDIFDWVQTPDKLYFSCIKDLQYKDLAGQSEKPLVKVPYIPLTNKGEVDHIALQGMDTVDSESIQKLESVISGVDSNAKIKLFYDNVEEVLHLSQIKNNTSHAVTAGSGKLAVATSEPLDKSRWIYDNLVDLIKTRSSSDQEIVYLTNDGQEVQTIAQLYTNATKCAKNLVETGVKPGDKLIFQINNRRSFLEAFWACMLIGVIPAPMTAIEDYEAEVNNVDKLLGIWELLERPRILVTNYETAKIEVLKIDKRFDGLDVALFNNEDSNAEIKEYHWDQDETCLILFTSGSTGLPKGVQLSQKNIFARTIGEIQLYDLDSDNVDLNWMTFTHAAGLIWSHIRDIFMNILQIQVNTDIILKNPLKWMELIDQYRVTITWAPNFAFALVADNIDCNKKYSWQLDCLKYAFAGGEANVSRVLLGFLNSLKDYGLDPNCIVPAFGMTETSSCVTYYNNFSPVKHNEGNQFLPVGEPTPGSELRIVDSIGEICMEGEIGYLQGRGPSYTKGYYKNDAANNDSFTEDGFLITGDLGFITDNLVTITGREKDIIIINGLNYYVHDFESAADSVTGVLASSSVATSVLGKSGTEEVIIFFTPERYDLLSPEGLIELKQLVDSIRKTVQKQCLINPAHIFPYSAKESARTELGKKQRNKYRNDYLEGKYHRWESKLEDTVAYSKLTPFWIESKLQKKHLVRAKYLFDSKEKMNLILGNSSHIDISDCINRICELKENDYLVDFTFYTEDIEQPSIQGLKEYYDKLSSHIRNLTTIRKQIQILFIVCNAYSISNNKWSYKGSDLLSLVKTLNQENSQISGRIIDLANYNEHLLRKELQSLSKEPMAVYRENTRYVLRFKTSRHSEISKGWIRNNHTILVAGGLGGIGVHLCSYLQDTYNANLVIVGRTAQEDNSISLATLERKGVRAIYRQADVTNYNQLCSLSKELISYGIKIDGIINLTGVLSTEKGTLYNENLMNHTLDKEEFENFYITSFNKVIGTMNLVKLSSELLNEPYLYLFGSVTSYFGSPAFGAYAGSNSMQEQYACYLRNKGVRIKSVLWSFWNKTGMASGIEVNSYKQNIFQHIEPQDGVACFNHVLESDSLVSIIGINRENQFIMHQIFDLYKPRISVTLGNHESKKFIQEKIISSSINNLLSIIDFRFDISSNVIWNEKLQEIWDTVAEIWKSTLKISSLDRDANIFDLGGDSITIYSISSKLSEVLDIEVKAIDVMMNPSINELVVYIHNKIFNINQDTDDEIRNKAQRRNKRRRASRKRGHEYGS